MSRMRADCEQVLWSIVEFLRRPDLLEGPVAHDGDGEPPLSSPRLGHR